MTQQKIALNNYSQLLLQLRGHIDKAQKNITRQKVVMAWKIGESIDQHLLQNTQSGYGEHLIEQLEIDIGITQSVLYKMRNFYKTYPKIPRNDDKLNWSHYRVLIGVKKDDERQYLENLTRENNWSSATLQAETKQSKISQIRKKNAAKKKTATLKKLYPKRGRLFCYNLTKLAGSKKIYLDCGFNFFREIAEELPKSLKSGEQIVQSVKNGEKYSFVKASKAERQINVYQAKLERVVDGDTLHVVLDLGFKNSHREILRLRGIDAPEMTTNAGKKSATALKNILKKVPFLIVKTSSTDIYGRYVADVFLAGKDWGGQHAADSGVYLNQLLLDRGLATVFS